MKTYVVNVYKEMYDVYIGRARERTPLYPVTAGLDGYFGNPFDLKNRRDDEERKKVLEQYREYFEFRLQEDPEFKEKILSLRGKRLGCFCAPKLCHGDVIAEYLNGLPKGNDEEEE